MLGNQRDFKSNFELSVAANFVTQADNTALVATVTRGYEDMSALALVLGSVADADATFTLAVTESDDNSSYDTAPISSYNGTLTGVAFDDDNTVHVVSYFGKKKYWRLTVTPVNNTGSLNFGILKISGHQRVQP